MHGQADRWCVYVGVMRTISMHTAYCKVFVFLRKLQMSNYINSTGKTTKRWPGGDQSWGGQYLFYLCDECPGFQRVKDSFWMGWNLQRFRRGIHAEEQVISWAEMVQICGLWILRGPTIEGSRWDVYCIPRFFTYLSSWTYKILQTLCKFWKSVFFLPHVVFLN